MDEVVAKERSKRRKLTFSQYYNSSQLRADTWNRLKHDALALAEAATAQGRHRPSLRDSVARSLDLLEPIEGYWVFPGREAIARLRRLLEIEDYRNLALLAGRIVRALSTDAYRRQTITLHGGQDGAERRRGCRDASTGLRTSRMAGPISRCWWSTRWGRTRKRRCKHGMRSCAAAGRPVPLRAAGGASVEDAMIAVLTNYNIQTVVIRFSFPYRTPAPGGSSPARAAGRRARPTSRRWPPAIAASCCAR